jgi:hypothetical protein
MSGFSLPAVIHCLYIYGGKLCPLRCTLISGLSVRLVPEPTFVFCADLETVYNGIRIAS